MHLQRGLEQRRQCRVHRALVLTRAPHHDTKELVIRSHFGHAAQHKEPSAWVRVSDWLRAWDLPTTVEMQRHMK